MLLLFYDVKCGFKELYVTEKDCSIDISAELINMNRAASEDFGSDYDPYTEEELYEIYKDDAKNVLPEMFDGIEEMLYEGTCEDYSHTYFKHICYAEGEKPFHVGYFKMSKHRLVLIPEIKVDMVEEDNCYRPSYTNIKTGKTYREYTEALTDLEDAK